MENNWYSEYKKDEIIQEAGFMDSLKGLFVSKPEQEVNKEMEYIDKVVSSLKEFIDSRKDTIKPRQDGTKKLALWIFGNGLLKSLMEETPWDKTDLETSNSDEQMQILDKRMKIVTEKLKSMGYNASLDYENKNHPVDLEILF